MWLVDGVGDSAARMSLVVRASEAERRANKTNSRKAKTQQKHASVRHKVLPLSLPCLCPAPPPHLLSVTPPGVSR